MKIFNVLFLLAALILASCSEMKEKTKEALHDSGKALGEGTSELVDGVKEGVASFKECKIELADQAQSDGLKVGKFMIEDGEEGSDNLLSVYVIFEKNFVHSMRARLLDEEGNEYGRTTTEIGGKIEDAGYVEFSFDPRSSIQPNSTIILEYP